MVAPHRRVPGATPKCKLLFTACLTMLLGFFCLGSMMVPCWRRVTYVSTYPMLRSFTFRFGLLSTQTTALQLLKIPGSNGKYTQKVSDHLTEMTDGQPVKDAIGALCGLETFSFGLANLECDSLVQLKIGTISLMGAFTLAGLFFFVSSVMMIFFSLSPVRLLKVMIILFVTIASLLTVGGLVLYTYLASSVSGSGSGGIEILSQQLDEGTSYGPGYMAGLLTALWSIAHVFMAMWATPSEWLDDDFDENKQLLSRGPFGRAHRDVNFNKMHAQWGGGGGGQTTGYGFGGLGGGNVGGGGGGYHSSSSSHPPGPPLMMTNGNQGGWYP